MSTTDEKIDKLAEAMEKGFSELRGDIKEIRGEVKEIRGEIKEIRGEVKEIRGEIKEIRGEVKEIRGDVDELARSTAEGFSEIRAEMATKRDLQELRGELHVMFDKFTGTVRKDVDVLTSRVKVLEETNSR